jgi:hypothetical protein
VAASATSATNFLLAPALAHPFARFFKAQQPSSRDAAHVFVQLTPPHLAYGQAVVLRCQPSHIHRGRMRSLPIWPASRSNGATAIGGITVLLSGVLSLGSCSASPDSAPKSQGEALVKNDQIYPDDDPSPLAVMLHWSGDQDGLTPVASLQFDIENTTDQPIDVDLYVTTQGGKRVVSRTPAHIRLNPRASVGQSVAVDQLGVQFVGSSTSTLVTAVYKGSDGVERVSPLPVVWVEHQPGFGTARVRTLLEEARENAGRGLANLRSRRPTDARVLDPASSRLSQIDALKDTSVLGGHFSAQLPELPDPVKYRASIAPLAQQETDGIPDAERPSPKPDADAGAFDKGGNFNVCFKLPFWYVDANFGEDYLIGQTFTTEGSEPARYMLAFVLDAAGMIKWSGNLDSTGCTDFRNYANGTYSVAVTTSIYRIASDVLIDVTVNDTKKFVWGIDTFTVSGSGGGTKTISFAGAWSLTNAAVAAANTLYRASFAYTNGARIDVFTDMNPPGVDNVGSAGTDPSGSPVWLGVNNYSTPFASFKVVVGHELGHSVQAGLFGTFVHDYANDSSTPACRCDFVHASGNSHCLQSRQKLPAAQEEGWGHSFAATSLNVGSQTDCTFVYYKEFKEDALPDATLPPLSKSCYNQARWMEHHCTTFLKGTEWDWMNFYWRLTNKDSYSFANFKSVYLQACGGSCSGGGPLWNTLKSAANTVFGAGSTKANAWINQGDAFGVDY